MYYYGLDCTTIINFLACKLQFTICCVFEKKSNKRKNKVDERIRGDRPVDCGQGSIIHQPHHETRDRLIIARDAGGCDMSILTSFHGNRLTLKLRSMDPPNLDPMK
jgi:hypothetical protein